MQVEVFGLLLIRKGTFFFIGTFKSANSKIFGKGVWFREYYILSETIYLVRSICFQHPMLLLKKNKNKTGIQGFFLALLYCHSFSLDILSPNQVIFLIILHIKQTENTHFAWKVSHVPFVTTAIRFCSCQCEFKG